MRSEERLLRAKKANIRLLGRFILLYYHNSKEILLNISVELELRDVNIIINAVKKKLFLL